VFRHGKPVRAIAVLTDGKTLISGAEDGLVRVWDLTTHQVRYVLDKASTAQGLENEPIYCLAISPDGSVLACGDADGQLALWDLSRAKLRALMSCGPHPNSVLSVTFSGDWRTLAAGCMSGPVRLVDVVSGKEKETVGKNWNPAWAVSFTPDGQKLLAGINDGAVEIWHLADHKEGGALISKKGYVTSLCSPPMARS
jgi:WD40 repeat protein